MLVTKTRLDKLNVGPDISKVAASSSQQPGQNMIKCFLTPRNYVTDILARHNIFIKFQLYHQLPTTFSSGFYLICIINLMITSQQQIFNKTFRLQIKHFPPQRPCDVETLNLLNLHFYLVYLPTSAVSINGMRSLPSANEILILIQRTKKAFHYFL